MSPNAQHIYDQTMQFFDGTDIDNLPLEDYIDLLESLASDFEMRADAARGDLERSA